MRYRALFIGGPLDGQEQETNDSPEYIFTEKPYPVHYESGVKEETVQYTYQLLFTVGDNLLYSMYGVSDSLKRLWERYAI